MKTLRNKLELLIKRQDVLNNASMFVSTPYKLVEKMIDQLPNDVLFSTTKTFIDYSCGTGTFLLCLFVRLFENLENIIPNEQERVRNIISRLFGVDNNKTQFLIARKFFMRLLNKFDVHNKKLNLYNEDSLKYNFNSMKFDVILGNPPFQPETSSRENNSGSGSGQKIWHKFIERAFDLVKDDGHLLFVTPHNWREGNFKPRSPCNKIRELIFAKAIKWYEDVKLYFPQVGHSNSIDAWHVSMSDKNTINQTCINKQLLPKDVNNIEIISKFFDVCDSLESIKYIPRRGTGSLGDI
jgi:SAM-dependent methyltransferase